jgi:FAD/FMN-containing dehydrogenase
MILEQLKEIVGAGHCVTDPQQLEPHVTEWRDIFHGKALALVAPETTEQVAAIVRACSDAGVGLVPQGGNTGLCGGAVPDESGEQVILSMSRMDRIRSIDSENFSMIVEAGCVLARVQEAAAETGRYFPLSLGAEGSCQIGGNLSTNAGGVNVIRYGSARQQVLGLEAVLADGSVLNTLRAVRKDNTGYDIDGLLIGSEGTLGIITAACLRLYPDPGEKTTFLAAVPEAANAVTLLGDFRAAFGDRIEAFELVSKRAQTFVERHIPGTKLPFELEGDWYILVETAVDGDESLVEAALASALNAGLVTDAVVAKSLAEAEALWRVRHSISEAQKFEGYSIKHDISVPISAMRDFLVRCEERLAGIVPSARPVVFGHIGDGNLHYNLTVDNETAADTDRVRDITRAIYDLVAEYEGSFSAEHGIGVTKKAYLESYRGDVEIRTMRRLKSALDPAGILNPGKVI